MEIGEGPDKISVWLCHIYDLSPLDYQNTCTHTFTSHFFPSYKMTRFSPQIYIKSEMVQTKRQIFSVFSQLATVNSEICAPWAGILNVANMSFNAICENQIIAKISEFTVLSPRLPNSCLGPPEKIFVHPLRLKNRFSLNKLYLNQRPIVQCILAYFLCGNIIFIWISW